MRIVAVCQALLYLSSIVEPCPAPGINPPGLFADKYAILEALQTKYRGNDLTNQQRPKSREP